MKIKIYAEDPNPTYFAGLLELQKQKKIKIEFINSRIIATIYRYLKGKKSIKELIKTITAPITIIFQKDLIISTQPYSNRIYYFLLLKFLNKNLIYYNSWPHWNNPKKYIKKPFFNKFFWKLFLKNTKVATVTHYGVNELKRLKAKPFYKPQSIDTNFFKDNKQKRSNNVNHKYRKYKN